jgi:hypothetical protein
MFGSIDVIPVATIDAHASQVLVFIRPRARERKGWRDQRSIERAWRAAFQIFNLRVRPACLADAALCQLVGLHWGLQVKKSDLWTSNEA